MSRAMSQHGRLVYRSIYEPLVVVYAETDRYGMSFSTPLGLIEMYTSLVVRFRTGQDSMPDA